MEEEDDRWICSACTFSNDTNCDACAMCYTRKPVFSWSLHRYRRSLSICSVSRCLSNILSGALTCVFALVGSLLGAIAGALAGRAAQSGLLRGAGLGAVAGAVLSVEVLEASRAYWHSESAEASSSPSVSDFLEDVISGRFRQDFLGSTISAAHRWQVSFADMSYEELYDMLLPSEGRKKGASPEFLVRLPHHTVTHSSRVDVYGDVICCTVCLQELQEGEIARTLPACKHMFHMKCVDQWLSRCLLCPVCRQYIEL